MKAVRIHHTGGPEVLSLEEIPLAKPTSGQVSMQVELAGVNFIDVYHRRGQYQLPAPFGIGIEGIGRAKSGERYFWLNAMGSYAQEINVAESALTPVPDSSLTNEELLPLLCQGMTAHYLADSAYEIKTGESALVTAAAGGVGLLLVQVLKARGARVIAVASTPERAALAGAHGADHVGMYSQMMTLVSEATEGRGVDVIYDSVGKDYFDQCLELVAPGGMLVLYGGASGAVPPFDLIRLSARSLAIRRPTLGTYTATSAQRTARLADLIALREKGALDYPSTKVFPLSQSAAAHTLIESRRYSGKIGIDPWKI